MRRRDFLALPILLAGCGHYRPYTTTLLSGKVVSANPSGTIGEQKVDLPGNQYDREKFSREISDYLGIQFSRSRTRDFDNYTGILKDSHGTHNIELSVACYDSFGTKPGADKITSVTLTSNEPAYFVKAVPLLDKLLSGK